MKKFFFMLLILGVAGLVMAQTTGDYRAVGSNTWTTLSIWQRFDGATWVAATSSPTASNANLITIPAGMTVRIGSTATIDQVVIETGGQISILAGVTVYLADGAGTDMIVHGLLKSAGNVVTTGTMVFETGGKYQHAWASGGVGAVPTATWNDGSVCEIIGYTSGGGTAKLQGTSQSFYDFIWNCPNQTQTVYIRGDSFRPVRHDFKVFSTGTSNLEVSANEPGPPYRFDLTNYYQGGGIFTISRNATAYVLNISGDMTMFGGTLTTGVTPSTINFCKGGDQTFTNLGGTISGKVDFVVKTGSTLDLGTSVLTGNGSFTLEDGAGLITADPNGISSSGSGGCVQVTGTRTYSPLGDYTFNGTAPQVTGNALTTANNVTLNNPFGVTFTNVVTVNGILTQTSGASIGTPTIDGYDSVSLNFLSIEESGTAISNFSVSTATPSLLPQRINRTWTITGTYSGTKSVTFYWTQVDDGYNDWTGNTPAVYIGATKLTPTAYNVLPGDHWVTVLIPNSLSKATYTIGTDNGSSLPIELACFTANYATDGCVRLFWTTLSETNVSGFRIYRNGENVFATSEMLNTFIYGTNSSEAHDYEFIDEEVSANGDYYYWLENLSLSGETELYGPVTVHVYNPEGPPVVLPPYTQLKGIYPNPFNPTATISYDLAKDEEVSIGIYNLRGQRVRFYATAPTPAGEHSVIWDGTDDSGRACSSGVYMVILRAGYMMDRARAILIK